MMNKWLKDFIEEHIRVISKIDKNTIVQLIKMVKTVRDKEKQIFVIGNGGDAACSSHLAVDLGKGASINKKKRFKIFSPVDNIPWLTALGNDLGYENIFVEQIENFCQKGDLLLVFSVSGSSPNIVKAVERAKELGLKTAAVVGDRNGKLIDMVDLTIVVPSKHYGHVEDIQNIVCHIIAYYFIENEP